MSVCVCWSVFPRQGPCFLFLWRHEFYLRGWRNKMGKKQVPRKSAQRSMNNKLRDDGVFAVESSLLKVRTTHKTKISQSNHIRKSQWISSLLSPFVSQWACSSISVQFYIWSWYKHIFYYLSLSPPPSSFTVNHSCLFSPNTQLHVGCRLFILVSVLLNRTFPPNCHNTLV